LFVGEVCAVNLQSGDTVAGDNSAVGLTMGCTCLILLDNYIHDELLINTCLATYLWSDFEYFVVAVEVPDAAMWPECSPGRGSDRPTGKVRWCASSSDVIMSRQALPLTRYHKPSWAFVFIVWSSDDPIKAGVHVTLSIEPTCEWDMKVGAARVRVVLNGAGTKACPSPRHIPGGALTVLRPDDVVADRPHHGHGCMRAQAQRH